jgi:hypothetical protein
MAKAKKKTPTSQLHGAALAARQRATGHHGHGKRKTNPANPAAKNPGRRPRRRNPKTTFVQAVGKVLGGAAAMFGSGVLVTLGTAKIKPGAWYTMYGIPVAAGLAGAAIATKWPVVGLGVAAGGAAPFVLPVASRMLQPATPTTTTPAVAGLRAVAMGNAWRSLNASQRMSAVRMGAVRMGTLYAT